MKTDNYLNLIGLSFFLDKLKTIFAIKEEVHGNQSDWNETDVNSISYVKNKPDNLTSEIISQTEPENQSDGNYWIQDY